MAAECLSKHSRRHSVIISNNLYEPTIVVKRAYVDCPTFLVCRPFDAGEFRLFLYFATCARGVC